MTAATLSPNAVPAAPHRPASTGVTFPRVVASEWIKFRTVRSTVWTLGVTVVLMVGISVLLAWGLTMGEGDPGAPGSVATIATSGYFLAQLTVAVLGVLAISGEYTTGMIRSTLTAVPTRLPALLAKALVVTVVVALVTLVGVALSYVATIPFHDELGVTLDLSDSTTVRILLGTPLYLATIALLAFAVGALLRHSAGALAAVLGLLLVIENVFALIPLTFFENISPFLPGTAGGRLLMDEAQIEMSTLFQTGPALTPWQGYAVLLAWALALLTTAAVLLRRRDA
ncbi:MAG: transporter permease [Actinotalea sp.]|nr:transporter permease [Actinotalea sp.]